MSTKAAIGILENDGTIRGICCNYDGYLQGVGSMLQKHYNSFDKANNLIGIGNIAKLHEDIDSTKTASLNRNATINKSLRFKNIKDFERYYIIADYYYLFDQNFWVYRLAMPENHSYQFLEIALNNLK